MINFEFPGNMADYIHRAGRLGRVGSPGTGLALNLIQHKWEVDLLWQIEVRLIVCTNLGCNVTYDETYV